MKFTRCRFYIVNCKIHNSDKTLPPINIEQFEATTQPYGAQPNISINNAYSTATLTNRDDTVFFIDSRRAGTYPSSVSPRNLRANLGDLFVNTDEATTPEIYGWITRVGGRAPTVKTITETAITTAASNLVTISFSGHTLYTGDIIKIAGETFGSGDDFAMIISTADSTTIIKLDKDAVTGVSGAVISYRGATFDTLAPTSEGTWTPADGSGAGLSFTTVSGRYIKTGNMVTIWGALTYPSTANGSSSQVQGLPFTVDNVVPNSGGAISFTTFARELFARTLVNTVKILFYTGGANATNADLSLKIVEFSATYRAA